MNSETKAPKLPELFKNKVSISRLKLLILLDALDTADKHSSNLQCVFLTSYGLVSGTLLHPEGEEPLETLERSFFDKLLNYLSDLESKTESPLEATDYGSTILLKNVTVTQGNVKQEFSSLTLFVNQIVGYSFGEMRFPTDV